MKTNNKIIFATNNKNKVLEIQNFVPAALDIITLSEIGITEDIPEPFNSFRENAWAKAKYVFDKTGQPCFAEDSGLSVNAVDGLPGVLSARFSGVHGNDDANNQKLLESLNNVGERSAYYTAVICLLINEDEVYYFEGTCDGTIASQCIGTNGFGYDPLFIPNGYKETFGVLPIEVKKENSHRSKAVKQLVTFLKDKYGE